LLTKPIPGLKLKGTFFIGSDIYFRDMEGRLLLGGARHIDRSNELSREFVNTDKIISHLKNLCKDVILPGVSIEIDDVWSGILGFD